MRDPWWVADVVSSYGDPAAQHTDRPAHTYLRGNGTAVTLSRAQLHKLVSHRAGAFAARGVTAGDRVALIAGEPEAFMPTFLALLWLGAVPVPLPPPPALGRRDAWRCGIDESLGLVRPRLVCGPAGTLDLLEAGTTAVAVEDLAEAEADVDAYPAPVPLPPDAPAYAQFTSGSTGRPRAVLATRRSLAANCAAITAGIALDGDRDVGVCWLPLHHDMGLVGFGCAAMTAGVPVVFLPTATFLRDPGVWMRTVSAYRGTVTFGPTFAYGLAARRARPDDVGSMDLSCVRVLGCGAEPINAATLERFLAAYAPAGLDAAALTPCYGLAEATLAVSFARGLRTAEDGTVDCGRPVPGHEVAVVDASGAPAAPGAVGEVWVRGPSVAGGYFGESAPETFGPDGWLRTGDLGYLDGGSLYLTGRAKDLLVVRGANTDPQRVEWAAATVPGVREGGVVAFTRPGADTEEVVVVVECAPNAPEGIPDAVRAAVAEPLGLSVTDVVRVRPGTVPKTTSGKPRRQETRRRYLAGELVR
ncbi:fatty acyl-AMP ligase [Planosporangium thailandense]|uniref:Fatty acyl-AMP ligase n=1 Tax=Planosporangium thailandense TaxID=765197 RepID=A0ABX0Y6V4_9ACTN|nr:AMP-binding protein [Planosporangium thailandense]NJC73160.1 fatty acyl-AMP ligase [Planosporangium thailandense]